MIIYGINPVFEALRAGRAEEVVVSEPRGDRVHAVVAAAARVGVPVRSVGRSELARLAPEAVHQGVVAVTSAPPAATLEGLASPGAEAPLLVVLDGVEDPQNVGAIVRSAHAAGASGVVRQTRRAAPLAGAAAKASAGAIHYVPVVDVVNIARALETLGRLNVWTVGLDADAELQYDAVDLTLPTAIVVGAEGAGLRRLVRERCDRLASIPMRGPLGSVNVSVAAAVVLFEAVRQRNRRRRDSVGRLDSGGG